MNEHDKYSEAQVTGGYVLKKEDVPRTAPVAAHRPALSDAEDRWTVPPDHGESGSVRAAPKRGLAVVNNWFFSLGNWTKETTDLCSQ